MDLHHLPTCGLDARRVELFFVNIRLSKPAEQCLARDAVSLIINTWSQQHLKPLTSSDA